MKRLWTALILVGALLLVGCTHHHSTTVTSTTTATTTVTTTPAAPSSTQIPGAANAHRPDDFGKAPPGEKLKAIAPSSTPTVEQFDDVTVSLLPSSAKYIGAYANGRYENATSTRTAFPKARIKTISVTAAAPAQCVDIEPGDATPSEAATFYRIARDAGIDKPCFYFPLSLQSAVVGNLTAAHIARASYWLWDAHWTGSPHIDAGDDGTQWTDHALGRSLDESTLTRAFAGVQAKPVDPRHWDWLPNTRRRFAITVGSHKVWIHARERNAVRNWDRAGCVNPVKRQECKVWRSHIVLLDGRIVAIANRGPGKPHWGRMHFESKDGHMTTLGGAHHQLGERERSHKPISKW